MFILLGRNKLGSDVPNRQADDSMAFSVLISGTSLGLAAFALKHDQIVCYVYDHP
jgi:hypothetical protein